MLNRSFDSKKLEPLKNKIRLGNQLMNANYELFRNTELFTRNSVRSAYLWFNKYVDSPEDLIKENPHYEPKIFKIFHFKGKAESFKNEREVYGFDSGYWLDYDKWLLKIAFADVIKVEGKNTT